MNCNTTHYRANSSSVPGDPTTRQLLAFGRRQVLQPRPLDLNAEIQSLEPVFKRTVGMSINLVLHLTPKLDPVRVDPGQLSQVLLNLILNARDAMRDGGTVTIGTASTTVGEGPGGQDGAPPLFDETMLAGSYAVVTVSDTGTGMDHDTLSRIFEPFFTTKPVGEGTGLGLSTVHGIVRQSGGYIRADSTPGRGATFTVYLPHAPTETVETPASSVPESTPRRDGTILVVDDEPDVRTTITRMLRHEGYEVLEAANGREALALAASGDRRLDLVITDLIMPGMSGGELAKELAALRPGLALLVTSGHSDDRVRRRGTLEPGWSFLQKPYSPDVLAAQVHQLLEAARVDPGS